MAYENEENMSPESKAGKRKFSRRDVLKKIPHAVGAGLLAADAAGVTTLVLGPTAKNIAESFVVAPSLEEEIERDRGFIKQRYGVEVDFTPQEGTPLITAEKRDVLSWLRGELAKYPPNFYQHFHTLKKFQVFNDIYIGEDLVGGYVNDPGSFDSASSAYKEVDRIILAKKIGFLNVNNFFGWTNDDNFKKTFHHELLHFTDFFSFVFKEGGIGNWPSSKPGDPFSGYVGDKYKSFERRHLFSPPAGFIRVYGMKNIFEDRATVAEVLLTDPKRLKKMTINDPLLSKKVADLKQRFYKISNGKMDEQYWQDLEHGNVKEGYWDKKEGNH